MTQDNKQLKETVIQFMEDQGKDSYNVNDISDALGHNKADDFKEVVKSLAALERDKQVFLTNDGKFKFENYNRYFWHAKWLVFYIWRNWVIIYKNPI